MQHPDEHDQHEAPTDLPGNKTAIIAQGEEIVNEPAGSSLARRQPTTDIKEPMPEESDQSPKQEGLGIEETNYKNTASTSAPQSDVLLLYPVRKPQGRNILWAGLIVIVLVGALVWLGYRLGPQVGSNNESQLLPETTPMPTVKPTSNPTGLPTSHPTHQPSSTPTGGPSEEPSTPPTVEPSVAPSSSPSTNPTESPSGKPTPIPSSTPSASPTTSPPTHEPTQSLEPSTSPTQVPTAQPSQSPAPSRSPTEAPTGAPTISSQPTLITATYVPGDLKRMEFGLLLSEGLRTRIVATKGEPVPYHNGTVSDIPFHAKPDFGATFVDHRPHNTGGWVYASNSEIEETGQGGVGSFTFDKDGNVIDYRMVLENTTMNCGGGRTPWNTWVSCEEVEFHGMIYQVDPFGERQGQVMTLGNEKGRWESFAYDVRDRERPQFFATEDHKKGTVRRFRPDTVDWDNPWDMLHVNGTTDYLIVHPNDDMTGGTFEYINDLETAKSNAKRFYPESEGIDVFGPQMFVVCKKIKQMFTFNLDDMTYENESTVSGLFDGGPDQMQRILDPSSDLLYFTEEGGVDAGVHARDERGRFYTILESPVYPDETTGLAFSPNGKFLYVAYQQAGLLFSVWREDGLPFHGRTLNVKYHQDAFG